MTGSEALRKSAAALRQLVDRITEEAHDRERLEDCAATTPVDWIATADIGTRLCDRNIACRLREADYYADCAARARKIEAMVLRIAAEDLDTSIATEEHVLTILESAVAQREQRLAAQQRKAQP